MLHVIYVLHCIFDTYMTRNMTRKRATFKTAYVIRVINTKMPQRTNPWGWFLLIQLSNRLRTGNPIHCKTVIFLVRLNRRNGVFATYSVSAC